MKTTIDILASPFALKRRSNPSAAFAEMVRNFTAATREDPDFAKAFGSFQEHFKGVVLEKEDSVRLATLKGRGIQELRIKVGSLPSYIGPGLALMYDAALETLRSCDRRIEPELVSARAIRILDGALESLLPLLGSMSVTAMELALDDRQFHDHLRQRGAELGTANPALDQPQGPCEHCVLQVKDEKGDIVDQQCGTEQQCEGLAILFILLLILWLGSELWDWLT